MRKRKRIITNDDDSVRKYNINSGALHWIALIKYHLTAKYWSSIHFVIFYFCTILKRMRNRKSKMKFSMFYWRISDEEMESSFSLCELNSDLLRFFFYSNDWKIEIWENHVGTKMIKCGLLCKWMRVQFISSIDFISFISCSHSIFRFFFLFFLFFIFVQTIENVDIFHRFQTNRCECQTHFDRVWVSDKRTTAILYPFYLGELKGRTSNMCFKNKLDTLSENFAFYCLAFYFYFGFFFLSCCFFFIHFLSF